MNTMFRLDQPGQAFGGSPQDFKNRAFTFLLTLCNDRNMERAASYLDPNCVLIHEDEPPLYGADKFISSWGKLLEMMPNYHKVIKDIVVEDDVERAGAKRVWVYSQITGISNTVRDSIDMMHFSDKGLFLDSKDVQRDTNAKV